jgi:hypothetical protein
MTFTFSPETHPYTCLIEMWIHNEKEKGLVDFKPFVIPKKNATVESISKELWALLNAPTIPDPDLF